MSDVEVGSKRSNDYDEYGEISYKRSKSNKQKMRFLLDGRNCGKVIGKGGENIKRLRSEYGIQVNLPDTRSNQRVLTLQGDRDSCVTVLKEIVSCCQVAPYAVDPKKKCTYEINFLAQSDQVGAVIGKGGEKIKDIREKSGGKVKVYQDCLPNSNERIVAIGGDEESRLLAAFDIVLDVLRDHPPKKQTIYYDPKNTNNEGESGSMMGGGNQFGGLGNGLGGLGGLGALGGLSGLAAGAATLLSQLGVGPQAGGGILGAAGAFPNLLGNNLNRDGILGNSLNNRDGILGNNLNNRDGILGTGDNRSGQIDNRSAQFDNRNASFNDRSAQFDNRTMPLDNRTQFENRSQQLDSRSTQFDNRSGQLDNRSGQSTGFGADQSNAFGMSHNAGGAFGQYNASNTNNSKRHNHNGFNFDDSDRLDFTKLQTVVKVTVSNDMCGAIIGKSGQRIKEVRQNTGAKVDFSATEKGSKEDRVITITGTQEQTIAAQQLMAQCVRNRNM